MKRIFNISRRMPGIRSMAAAAALGIMPVATGSAQAQTVFMDDFDDAWDYSFGSVPSGGIWTGGYNFGDGGPHDSGITVPGHLTMGLDGVAWEENITTGPMQYVIIDASQPFSVTIKISSQTAGALSQAGLIVRAPQDLGSGTESYVHLASFLPGAGPPEFRMTSVHPTSPEFDGDGDTDGRDFLIWQRATHVGGGQFNGYYSDDGVNWILSGTVMNPDLASGPLQLGVWAGAIGALPGGTVSFDFFQVVAIPEPSTLLLGMAATNAICLVVRRRKAPSQNCPTKLCCHLPEWPKNGIRQTTVGQHGQKFDGEETEVAN